MEVLLLLQDKRKLFFFFNFGHDIHGYRIAEDIPNVSFKIPSLGEALEFRTAVCILIEMDHFK